MDRAATRMNVGVLVPIIPLQLCNWRILLLGSCVPPAWPNVPVCFLGAELSCYLNAACWLLPTAVAEGSTRKDVLATVGPGFFFAVLFLTVSPLLSP